MATYYQLDFEKGVHQLEQRIEQAEARLKAESALASTQPELVEATRSEILELKSQRQALLEKTYAGLSAWDTVRVARHPQRPQTRDYIQLFCRDFVELHGDRRFGDDPAIITGFARIGANPGLKVLLVGHQKGKTTSEKIACHFGCAHPEGYRKALHKMQMAAKFHIPIVTLVDTPGAYPGLGAEQRGQAEAIAVNMMEMSRLPTPIVSIIIGEGGSGGALGIAVADRVAMLSNSWYSVISPEGCAAILWKEANDKTNALAARSLRLTARDNLENGIIDEIIQEPAGGAHRDPVQTASALQNWIMTNVQALSRTPVEELLERRYQRYRKLGAYLEQAPSAGA